MFKRISIKQQLYALCGIFLAPLCLLAVLLADQADNQISFSNKERQGVQYLKPLFSALADVAAGKEISNGMELGKTTSLLDPEFKSWEQSTAFRLAATSGKPRTVLLQSGNALVTAVGDGSNLILDPDLDSYYVMDIIVIRLPEILGLLSAIDTKSAEFQTAPALATINELTVLKGQLIAARTALNNSMNSAMKNNPAGDVAKTALTDYAGFLAGTDKQIERLQALIVSGSDTLAASAQAQAIRAAHAPLVRDAADAYAHLLSTLDGLIRDRIFGQYAKLLLSLAAAIAAAALALWAALRAANRISANVEQLSDRIHGMTKGDYASPIPLQEQDDELGSIARSLMYFREHAEEKAELADKIEQERRSNAEKLEHLAYVDDLTGLSNRKFMNNAMESHFKSSVSAEESALIYFDLDGFKEVNDTLTHIAGDEVLQEMARRLEKYGRSGDVVARLGGDEFAIFMPVAPSRDDLMENSRQMLVRLSEPVRTPGGLHFLSASAGISILPLKSAHDSFELIRRADVAMYRAKAMGKSQAIIFDPTFDAEVLQRKEIEHALREAVDKEDIKLFFQPQFDVTTGHLVGVEGLARWTHRRMGDLSPSTFIPIAETSGLIHKLGKQLMRQAFEAAERWPDIKISVNLSVAQLRSHGFMNDITTLVSSFNVPLNRIELEITESVMMDASPILVTKLNALRDIGFELALDDFGTGFASLGYLSRFHFDRLKIDRTFVAGAQDSPRGVALLKSIADMGRALGMDVCAEGVENYEGLQMAANAGCTTLQGFYFSPAVLPNEIDHMLAKGAGAPARSNAIASEINSEDEDTVAA